MDEPSSPPPPGPKKSPHHFQIVLVLQYMDMFKSKNYDVSWTVSMCTTSLHSKLYKIVFWYECTRIIWMDYLLRIILH